MRAALRGGANGDVADHLSASRRCEDTSSREELAAAGGLRSFSSNQLPTAFERATHALPAVHSAA
jgi:hypothetical protein